MACRRVRRIIRIQKVIVFSFVLLVLISSVASKQAPAQQAVPQQSSSKRIASPPLAVQRKVARTTSTIASRGHGGGPIAAHPRQLPGPSDEGLRLEAPHDVLDYHHHRNGAPRAPDPHHLASIADKSQTDGGPGLAATQTAAVAEAGNSVGTKPRNASNNNPTTLKYYDLVWKTILIRVKFLSRLDSVINDAFPERQAYLSAKAAEFINQAIAELQADGVPPDEAFLKEHQCHMCDFVRPH